LPAAAQNREFVPADQNLQAVSTRYDKLGFTFLYFVLVAAVFEWLKSL
jgi:hypothetical protein